MKLPKLFSFALASICAVTSLAQVKPPAPAGVTQSPFFCNLKAFQPVERKHWRALIEEVVSAVDTVRELSDGYALGVNARRTSFIKVAEWIDLERKCCPFFDFQVELHGEDGTIWLSLKGRDGVKQFIQQDFTGLEDKLGKPGGK